VTLEEIIPSLDQANISLETDKSIAGRSLISAIVAPIIIKVSNPLGKTALSNPGAEISLI
jgi:hypothetical protein